MAEEPDKKDRLAGLVDSILSRVSTNPLLPTAFPLRLTPKTTLDPNEDDGTNAPYLTNKKRLISLIDPKVKVILELLVKGEANWPLTLWGPPGTGKTSAALALLDRVASNQRREWKGRAIFGRGYYTLSDFCKRANDAKYNPIKETYAGFVEKIECAALLVIDEVDRMETVSDTRHETLTDLLDRREGMPLVLLSNSSPDQLGQMYGARVPSRLANGVIYKMDGPDRRISKGGK